ncbi:hypothetical protein B0O99DRAFT_679808 [Bisporella sp. PMI_857]|nr:hypothetical protein B0O99DRAFT_679808 [Bisporella sp. PMI_857]
MALRKQYQGKRKNEAAEEIVTKRQKGGGLGLDIIPEGESAVEPPPADDLTVATPGEEVIQGQAAQHDLDSEIDYEEDDKLERVSEHDHVTVGDEEHFSEFISYEPKVIQAAEWDELSPNDRAIALSGSLMRAVEVLELFHSNLLENLSVEE